MKDKNFYLNQWKEKNFENKELLLRNIIKELVEENNVLRTHLNKALEIIAKRDVIL